MTPDEFATAKRFEPGVVVSGVAWIAYLTALVLALHSVSGLMSVGGSCGSGARVPCPAGIAVFMPICIAAMIVAVFIHAIGANGWGPSLAAWFWPILFTGLSATFFLGALGSSTPVGYLLGGMFLLMSGSPLLVLSMLVKRRSWPGWKALGLRQEDSPEGNNLLAGLIFLGCCVAVSTSLAGFASSLL